MPAAPALFSFVIRFEPFIAKATGVVLYLLLVNLTGALLLSLDKKRAVFHNRRIPERVFFVFAFLGAGIGEIAAMYHVRHKTKHRSFVIGIPFITVLFYCLLIGLLYLAR